MCIGRYGRPVGLRFGPEQYDEFEAAREDLVRRFDAATGGEQGWAARDVLEYKWQYLDGDLTEWSVDDVEALLFEIFPAKVTLGPHDSAAVIAGFAAFLRFLSHERLLSEGTGERLAKRVEAAQAEFEAAMSDEERFSFGKRLVAEMVADGVDPTDQEAMNEWITSFNERTYEERDRVVGPALERNRRTAEGGEERTRLPPVVLASEDEVRAAAGETKVFGQVRDLVGFMGEGRKLTDKGNLTVADAKALKTLLGTDARPGWARREEDGGPRVRSSKSLRELDLLFRVAVAGEFLETPSARTVRPGPAAGLLDSDPLGATGQLLEAALIRVGLVAHDRGDDHYGFGWYAEDLDEGLTRLVLDLYVETEPLPIEEFIEEVWADLHDLYDLSDVDEHKLDLHLDLMESSARRALRQLSGFGVVEMSGVESVQPRLGRHRRISWRGLAHPAGPVVGARDPVRSGRRASGGLVGGGRGGRAPRPGGRSARGHRRTRARGLGAGAWRRRVGPADRRAGPGGGNGSQCRVACAVWPRPADGGAGGPADQGPGAWPLHALIWRGHTLAAAPEELDVGRDGDLLVRVLNGVLTLWGPEAMTAWLGPASGGTGAQAAVDSMWRVRRPDTESVLMNLGEFHPDKHLAKAARKSLFKFRSSGGAPS